MPRTGTNVDVNTAYSIDMDMDEYTYWLNMLPEKVARWVEFDAPVSFNPRDIYEFWVNEGFDWDYVFRELKFAGRDAHRHAFGGVHPGLDQPRRVW